MDSFTKCTIVWATVSATAIISIFGTICFINHNNVEFDKTCIYAGKAVVWETKQGSDYTVKECK